MSEVVPGLLSVLVGGSLLLIGRWGLRNGQVLVSPHLAASRREKEIGQILRGSRSCMALGAMFCVVGLALAVSGARP